MTYISEADIESLLLEQLQCLGYTRTTDARIGPDGSAPEREAYSDVLLLGRLRAAIDRLNPHIPAQARHDALMQVVASKSPSLIEENRRLHRLMVEGVGVEFLVQEGAEAGTIRGDRVRLVDFADPDANDWLAVAQFTVIENGIKRRADVVLFVNGLPLVVIELKNAGDEQATLHGAFNQLQTYKAQIPSLFRTNAVLVTSDGLTARIGSLTANAERFMPWRTTDGRSIAPKTAPELSVLIEGVCERRRFLDLLQSFIVFGDTGSGLVKIIAGYHQFHAVQLAVASTVRAIAPVDGRIGEDPETYGLHGVKDYRRGDRRVGVIWHTQGSGKSLLMVFYAGQLVRCLELENPTILVITGEIGYGFAKYLRDALPNASFIGFTGTPIERDDINTPAVFGDYIDVYDISRAVADGATVPIYYESRLARIALPDDQKPLIDAEIEDLTEDDADTEQERLKRKWSTVEALVGSEQRLALVAADLVRHFEDRVAALDGKAMIVCMSRRICVALYQALVALRPDWHADDDQAGLLKVVMTGSAADPLHWQSHIGNKPRRDLLARRIKDPDDPLQLVIVRDMWLTGFDAPCLHTLYADKPMRGSGLMQAIARVNRVFRDKPAGLVVDYIGIAQNLKEALGQYSGPDQGQTGIDEAQAVAVLLEKYDVVAAMYHGFDYRRGLAGTPHQRLVVMAEAIEWILARQHQAAGREKTAQDKKRAHRRYQDAVLALSKAFALTAASDPARAIRDEVAFFQIIRAALTKSAGGSGQGGADRDFAIAQILDRAVVSTEIVDILAAAGLTTPDISILSDEFLAEVGQMEKKNLALEALRRLLNDEIRSRTRSNVVETRRFSERLEAAIARYHTNAVSTVEILQELIELARDIREARQRGEAQGLSLDEIAFYDALAENQSAIKVMGNDKLKVIAHELLTSLRGSITVDWSHRENARARMRILVKRILRKYGYPPDLESAAVQTVLAQAEALSAQWAA